MEHDDKETHQGGEHSSPLRVLNLVSLVGITYFCVSGGPFGSEVAVSAAPPLYVLLGFLLVPFFWGIPMSLLTAELSCAFSQGGGCISWSHYAFGDLVSSQVGWYSWLSNMVDLCLYPKMFSQYLLNLTGTPSKLVFWTNYLIQMGVVWVVTLLNISGVELVGLATTFFGIIVFLPFLLMIMLAFIEGKVDPRIWIESKWTDSNTQYQWGLLLSTIIWSFSGYDSTGQLAAEVKNPPKTYPAGMLIATLLSIVTYLGPILIGMGVDRDFGNWSVGEWQNISQLIGGDWLSILINISGIVSGLGLFTSLSCNAGRNLAAQAKNGFIPEKLATLHPTKMTPYLTLIINSIVVSVFLILPFDQLLELDVVLYTFTIFIDYIVWAKLKWKHQELERPYKMPGGRFAYLWIIPPMALCVFNFVVAGKSTQIYGVSAAALGLVIAFFRYLIRRFVLKRDIQNQIEKEKLIGIKSVN